ncbi:MAG: helix-turn-helix transcriptional regulator [Adlercreutzia sp.]|nr:helix-turn-helix transcriptional regulator [Adlercreutzia sp.]
MNRLEKLYRGLAGIPLVFLGIGVQRAWAALLFDGSIFATSSVEAYVAGMACTVVVNVLLAAFAPRLCPLYRRPWLIGAVAGFACLGSALIVVDTLLIGQGALSFAGTMLAMTATGASMLVWCEFFGSLNVTRVALFYSAALVLGELLTFFLSSMPAERLWPLMIVMPLLNIVWAWDSCVRSAREPGSRIDAPLFGDGKSGRVTYPVKLVVLMAVVSFAESFYLVSEDPSSVFVLLCSVALPCLIVLAVLSGSTRFRVDRVYRVVVPLVIVAMITLMPGLGVHGGLSAGLFSAGDIGFAIVVMIVFSGISYRYGLSAVRLNGIERGVRYTAYIVGWLLGELMLPALTDDQVFGLRVALSVISVALFVVLFMANSDMFARWGVQVVRPSEGAGEPEVRIDYDDQALRALACESLAKEFGLTAREQEIALLLAQKRTNLQIEKHLVIAQGTLKAHVSHIYTKLDVHSRNEFYAVLEAAERRLAG